MIFKNLKLSYKYVVLFMVMALIAALTGVFGIWSMNRVGGSIQGMLKARAAQEKIAILMKVNLQECRVTLLEAAMAGNQDEFELSQGDYESKFEFFTSYCDLMLKGNPKIGIPPAPSGSPLELQVKKLKQGLANFQAVGNQLIARKQALLRGAGMASVSLTDPQLVKIARIDLLDVTDKARVAVDDLLVIVGNLMNDANKEAALLRHGATITFVVVIIVAIVLAVLLGMLSTSYLVQRIKAIDAALHQGAQGDLTAQLQIDSSDELGTLGNNFNSMASRLSQMIGKVKRSITELAPVAYSMSETSGRVVNAAEIQAHGAESASAAGIAINVALQEIAAGVDSLSQSAAETSSSSLEMAANVEEVAMNAETLSRSVDEVSSSVMEMAVAVKQIDNSVVSLAEAAGSTAVSIEQMNNSIGEVEKNVADTAVLSTDVLAGAEEGKKAVEAAMAGMEKIKHASGVTTEVITTLSDRVREIGTILAVIEEVTSQTNLLALNAAIIAAQSGDHGKGFMVVADEMKELADRTNSSTREIADVIKGVQREAGRAVEAIASAEQSIKQGEELSRISGDVLSKIVADVKLAGERVAGIARATQEQAKGSGMIREAIEQVSRMASQIARATNEQGKGSELITQATERMKDLTAQVRRSTHEQSKVGNAIAKATENIKDMIARIKDACDEQTRGSSRIVAAASAIQETSGTNLGAARSMDEAVSSLSRQIELLEQEVAGFMVLEG